MRINNKKSSFQHSCEVCGGTGRIRERQPKPDSGITENSDNFFDFCLNDLFVED